MIRSLVFASLLAVSACGQTQAAAPPSQEAMKETYASLANCGFKGARFPKCDAYVVHTDYTVVRLYGIRDGKALGTTNDKDIFVYDDWFRQRYGNVSYRNRLLDLAVPGRPTWRDVVTLYYQGFQGP